MNLDYLKKFVPHNSKSTKVQFELLENIQQQRSSWIKQDISGPFQRFFSEENLFFKSEHVLTNKNAIEIGQKHELTTEGYEKIQEYLKSFIPWRKGPFKFFNIDLDCEWRSDLKWQRIEEKIDFAKLLKDAKVLDIGCNNGYFMFKMSSYGPQLVLGIDPVLRNLAQFQLLQNFAQIPSLHFELFGIEHLGAFKKFYDVIFSMGILYHHRSPLDQLMSIRESLVPGGTLVLETLIYPGEDQVAFTPQDRYAKMRNVFFLPTANCLSTWLEKCKFTDIQLIDINQTSTEEQRNTPWCPLPQETLQHFLSPDNVNLTVEGLPAPRRAIMIAKTKK